MLAPLVILGLAIVSTQSLASELNKSGILVQAIAQLPEKIPCHLLPIVGKDHPSLTPQHFAFPRDIVHSHTVTLDGPGDLCLRDRCPPQKYAKLYPRDISHQTYDPGQKKYFLTMSYSELPDEASEEELRRIEAEPGEFVGYAYYNAIKISEPFRRELVANYAWYARPEGDLGRKPSEAHLPYVHIERREGEGYFSWEGRKANWNYPFQTQDSLKQRCNENPDRCVFVYEMCFLDQKSGYPNNVKLESDELDFAKNEGATSVGYAPFQDPPVYWGHLVTSQYSFEKIESFYNKMELTLLVTRSLLPGSSAFEALACLDSSTLDCWAHAGISAATDIATIVIPIAKSGQAMRFVKSLTGVSAKQLGTAGKHLYRIGAVGQGALAAVHARRGEIAQSIGYALGPGIDIGVLAYTKFGFRFSTAKKWRTFDECPEGVSPDLPVVRERSPGVCVIHSGSATTVGTAAKSAWLSTIAEIENATEPISALRISDIVRDDPMVRRHLSVIGEDIKLRVDPDNSNFPPMAGPFQPKPFAQTRLSESTIVLMRHADFLDKYSVETTLFHEISDAAFIKSVASSWDEENLYQVVFKPEYLDWFSKRAKDFRFKESGKTLDETIDSLFVEFSWLSSKYTKDDLLQDFTINTAEFVREMRSRRLELEFYERARCRNPEIQHPVMETRLSTQKTEPDFFRKEVMQHYVEPYAWTGSERLQSRFSELFDEFLRSDLVDDWMPRTELPEYLTEEILSKIIHGKLKPAKPGSITEPKSIVGGHLATAHTPPFGQLLEKITEYPDGSYTAKFKAVLPDGSLSNIKKSSVFPPHFSSEDLIEAIIQIRGGTALATRPSFISSNGKLVEGAKLYQGVHKGVNVEVLTDLDGNVTAAYGGQMSTVEGFLASSAQNGGT
jgi:hypothetical protein